MDCFKCRQPIREAHLLFADDQYWHEDCLRCACCDVRLAELDKVCYFKAKMPLCRRDYLRLYGRTGECVVCQKRIFAFELVMRIFESAYHLNCFCCQRCQMRFCVGDRFYVYRQAILCEQDYTEMALIGLQPTALPNNWSKTVEATSQQHASQNFNFQVPNTIMTLSVANYTGIRSQSFTKTTQMIKTNVAKNASEVGVEMDIFTTDSFPTIKCDDEIYEFQMSNCSDELSSGYGSPSPLAVTQLERFST
ncbi:LIM domain only protein 3 [Paragonimus heterotremus]|uniref:LIM domain only protein 3 n=1 Tax=Paragonimus heterotremus TaxID=100268 RepID=A0A8J4SJ57_9TREM|nr:LIM domain only protein 3 [Paragonimus heterotremus]